MLELIDAVEISETELDAIEALEMQRTNRFRPAPLPGTRYDYEGIAEADMLATGANLVAVKDKLKHGRFKDWLKAEFDMTDRTAQTYMWAARVFGGMPDVAHVLGPGSIRKLSAKGTPVHVRNSIIGEIRSGKVLSEKDISDRIKTARGSHGSTKQSAASNAAQPAITSTGTGTIGPDAAAEAQAREKAAKAGSLLKERLGAGFPCVANWFSRIPAERLDIYKEELLKLAGTSASALSTAPACTDEHEAANAVAAS